MKVGETVQFVTGSGPIMSVTEVLTKVIDTGDKGKGNIHCKWWVNAEKNFKDYYFMEEELTPYKQGPRAMVT